MRAFLNREHPAAFSPEAIDVLADAFDEAWALIGRRAAINDSNREANRLKLARLVVVLAKPGNLDRERLRDSAILHFSADNGRSG